MAKKAKPAAVMGSLVNLKNVATHKSIALTIHIPAEAAQEVLAAFGWPTMVDPVPVAVARLEESASLTQAPPYETDNVYETLLLKRARDEQNAYVVPPAPEQLPRPHPAAQASAEMQLKARHWSEMTPAQQTGVIRNERNFWDFAAVASTDEARDYIRWFCGVKSCADIVPDTEAAAKWAQLQVRYGNWLRKWGRAA